VLTHLLSFGSRRCGSSRAQTESRHLARSQSEKAGSWPWKRLVNIRENSCKPHTCITTSGRAWSKKFQPDYRQTSSFIVDLLDSCLGLTMNGCILRAVLVLFLFPSFISSHQTGQCKGSSAAPREPTFWGEIWPPRVGLCAMLGGRGAPRSATATLPPVPEFAFPHFDTSPQGVSLLAPKLRCLLRRRGSSTTQSGSRPPCSANSASARNEHRGLLQQGLRWLPTMLATIRTIASTAMWSINGPIPNGPAAGGRICRAQV